MAMSRLYEARLKAGREASADKLRPSQPRAIETLSDIRFSERQKCKPQFTPRLKDILRTGGPWPEKFRGLRARIRSLEGESDRIRLLGLVSAIGSEGKTTIAIGLSIILSEEPNTRVLLLDADLRHRDLEKHLGIKPGPGLSDWLKAPKEEVPVQRLSHSNTFVLGAGRPPKNPWELITSPHLPTLFNAARRQFRYVVVDCPPQVPVADTARIQESLDGILFVVRARSASRETLLAAVDQMQTEKILGVIYNDARATAIGYQDYGYHWYTRHE
jgi:capsular exopolysaccharide synthesis family protein